MKTKTFSRVSMLAVVIVSLFVLFWLGQRIVPATVYPPVDDSIEEIDIMAPSGIIKATVARTDTDRSGGLSGRTSLATDAGMLFIFPTDGSYGFWMKDMRFSIDIVWIDQVHTVLGVTREVSPETYPDLFFPPAPIRYVLELNSGSAERFGIASGTKLVF